MSAVTDPVSARSLNLRPWIILAVFSLVGFLINASTFYALGVVLPRMVADQNWTWLEAGLGFTILGAACGFSSFLPAMMIRWMGVRATLIVGSGVMAAGFACLAATHGLVLYYLGACLCGVGFQMMALIPGTHVLAALFIERERPFGIYFTACSLGGVAGPWLALSVLHGFHDQWRVFWLIQLFASAGLGLVCAALVGRRAWLAQASARTDQAVAETLAKPVPRHVWRTPVDWTVAQALRTPQFYVLLAAYFGHLFVGVSVASLSTAHLTERHVAMTMAVRMLSLEALAQTLGRALGGLIGAHIEPRLLLMFALASLVIGAAALGVAHDTTTMLIFAIGSGLGFGLTAFAVTLLLLNYFGRTHNLELFSLTCLVGGVSALGPTIGGALRDATGGFGSTFEIYAGIIGLVLVAVAVMRPPRMSAAQEPLRAGPEPERDLARELI